MLFEKRKRGRGNAAHRKFTNEDEENVIFCNNKWNVFVKPNEQNRACSSYAMARKGRMKSNICVVRH